MSNNLQIDKLTGRENYSTWRFAVKSYLQHEELWSCVDPDDTSAVDAKKDVKAKSKIVLLVEPINYVHIESATSAREMWINLQKAFEDSGLTRKVGLLKDLINTSLDSCVSIEEYVNKIMTTAHKLRNIGFKVDDEWLGTLMLAGLPETYKPMIMGLESSGIKISSDFIKTKLLQEVKVSESTAFYTKHKSTPKNQQKPKGKGPRCYNCNQYGHFKNQCTIKKNNNSNNVFSAIFSAYSTVNTNDWYIDSGATMHMCRHPDWMYDLQIPPIQKIMVANNDAVTVQKMGNVNIKTTVCNDEHLIQVRNVLLVPELSANLLSVSQLTKKGCKVEFTDEGCVIYNSQNSIIATARLTNNMYKLNTVTGNACAVAAVENKADLNTWHRRMGHLNIADVKKLEKCAEGVNISNTKESTSCLPCFEAKQTRLPFPHSGSRADTLLEIVHSDVCGPMETPSRGGAKYFITFIDDKSRKVYVYFLKNKMDIKSVFAKYKNEVENQLDKKIKILRTDNGTEYMNKDVSKFLTDCGIRHQTSTPYTPEQNGLAERMNRTLVERAKCMLFDANLDKGFWAEAVATAAYIINRSPSKVLEEQTPEEKWSGKKPNLAHMKIFGSKAMVHVPKQKRLKWDKKSEEMIFMGYCDNTKGYRLYNPRNKQIITSRDVIFIENANIDNEKSVSMPHLAKIQLSSSNTEQLNQSTNSDVLEETLNATDETLNPLSQSNISTTSFESCQSNNRDETYYPDTDDYNSDSFDSFNFERNITLRPHQRSNVEHSSPGHNFMCVPQDSDPLTVEEALSSAESRHWKEAMDEEYKSLLENNTFEITSLPESKRAIPCKWVFKKKTDENGKIVKYKARLVIKGCAQKKGIDYQEVFSPVVRMSSLRYLFALAVKYNLDIYQMDAVSAFLQGDVEEEIYMTQPPMYESDDGKVCLLKKSLYGLKQASRQWNKKLDSSLKDMGLLRSKLDPCIYYKITGKDNILFMAIYVDDILIFTNNSHTEKYIKNELMNRFHMKDLGEVKYCLGLHVQREKGSIYIDQKKYITEVLNKYGMADCKPVMTPMDVNLKFKEKSEETTETEEEKEFLKRVPYQEIIGCLLYISQGTRPDICYVVNKLSKYNNKFEKQHWLALKRVLRYLKGTLNYKLSYKQSDSEELCHAYCDADWASSEDDRRSCTGYVFVFQGGSISWNSRRQPTVALSTTEAEYMSLASCVQEALWLKQMQEEFWPHLKKEALGVYCDNQSCIKLSGTDGFLSRTKHIDVRHHFIRDKVLGGTVDVRYVQSAAMVADVLTKATPLPKLQYCSTKMGLCLREDEELAV